MAIDLRGIQIFIASPGGLEEERRQFRETLQEFNEDLGHDQGVSFIPVGWELTRPGMGRPQEKINEDVRQSDFTVLVLWDRWGTDPGSGGAYTSGTEEEYNVARECIASDEYPMRDMLVLFKGVDAKQLSDPGQQLERVLAFKKTLEKEKSLLFQTFDTVSEFERHLRRQLAVWARNVEDAKGSTTAAVPPDSSVASISPDSELVDETADLVEQADALAKAGRLVEAESAYARAVVGRQDLHALTKYVRFLRRNGRLDQASALSDRLLEMAQEQNNQTAQIEALSNRAIVKRKLGDLVGSIKDLEKASRIAEAQGQDGLRDLAFLLDNIGLTQRKAGQISDALKTHLRAVQVRENVDDPRGMANALNHTGALMSQMGRFADAERLHRQALASFIEQEYPRGQAQAYANLGEDLLALDQLDEAEECLTKSLQLNKELNSAEGMGMNHWQLGRLALKRGDLEAAREEAYLAFEADDSSGRPEGVAGAYHLLGQILILENEPRSALPVLESALETYEQGGHRLGQAWTSLDLARARYLDGDKAGGDQALSRARSIGGTVGNAEFDTELAKTIRDQERNH